MDEGNGFAVVETGLLAGLLHGLDMGGDGAHDELDNAGETDVDPEEGEEGGHVEVFAGGSGDAGKELLPVGLAEDHFGN